MKKSEPGRAAQFADWQRIHEDHVLAEIKRRHLPLPEGSLDPTLSPDQVKGIQTAGWDPSEPGSECLRRTGPFEPSCPSSEQGYVEMAVYAKEIEWRFGEGPEPLGVRAARKLAAVIHLERGDDSFDEHDALQRWFEFEEWWVLRMNPAILRTRRIGRVLAKIDEDSKLLRDRNGSREDLVDAFLTRWIPSCEVEQAFSREMFRRPHLELDDDLLARMLKLVSRHIGTKNIPDHLTEMTPRELLSCLMESRDAGDVDVLPLVVRLRSGEPRVDCVALSEALRPLCNVDPDQDEKNLRSRWMGRLSSDRRLSTETVLGLLEMHDVVEGLDARDRAMLAIQGLQRTIERWVLSPVGDKGAEVTQRQMRRTLMLAIDGVVRAIGTPTERWFGTMRGFCRDYTLWSGEMLALLEKATGARTKLSEIEWRRISWYVQARDSIGPPRDWKQFKRATKRAAAQLGQLVKSAETREYLGAYRKLTMGKQTGVFASADGRILLAERQMRDRMSAAWGLTRHRRSEDWLEDPTAPPSKYAEVLDQTRTGELADDPTAEGTVDPLDALEAIDLVRNVREVVERRSREATPCSIRALVTANFEALGNEMSARDLAKRTGHAHGAISREYKKVRKEVAEELGLL